MKSTELARTEKATIENGEMGKTIVEDTYESDDKTVIYNSVRIEDQFGRSIKYLPDTLSWNNHCPVIIVEFPGQSVNRISN